METKPVSLKRVGDGLRIEWSDGIVTFLSWRELRKNCPCATCNDLRAKPPNPLRVLSDRELAAGAPDPVAMKPVGLYAYQISWNDGHSTGIYTVTNLRAMSKVIEAPSE